MTQIGKYEIVRQTGQTPLGTLYLAFDPVMQRVVSIQSPESNGVTQEPKQRQTAQIALKRGGESLSRLNHPNIRNILAAEEADDQVYLVMEHVHARSLSERTASGALPSSEEAVALLKMIAAALDHAHEHEVFHPGLTPSCLLVDDAGLLKVAGFEMSGLPVLPEEEASLEELKNLLTSVSYRAPEFFTGGSPDARADQFSLAAIAFELLTGQRCFHHASPIGVMSALLSGVTPDWSLLKSYSAPAVRRVLERALASDPAQRYLYCKEFVEAFETACEWQVPSPTRITPAQAISPVGSKIATRGSERKEELRPASQSFAQAKERNARKLRWILTAACLVAAAAFIFIVLQLWPSNKTQRPQSADAKTTAAPQAPTGDTRKMEEEIVKKVVADSQNKDTAKSGDKPIAATESGPAKSRKTMPSRKQARQAGGPTLQFPEPTVSH